MGPTWGPPGSRRPQMGPMLVPWTLLSGTFVKGLDQWPVDSPHKEPVMYKVFPCYDITMSQMYSGHDYTEVEEVGHNICNFSSPNDNVFNQQMWVCTIHYLHGTNNHISSVPASCIYLLLRRSIVVFSYYVQNKKKCWISKCQLVQFTNYLGTIFISFTCLL